MVGDNTFAIEPLLVSIGSVSVTEPVLESIDLVLLDHFVNQPIAAEEMLDGVITPLSETLYKRGKNLPRPMDRSMRLYVLFASVPVPKTRKAT